MRVGRYRRLNRWSHRKKASKKAPLDGGAFFFVWGVEMGLFLTAAREWDRLLDTVYLFTIGRKGELRKVELQFQPVDFDHLSGIHYASDIDFKLHRNEYRGEKLVEALLSGKLDDGLIEKSGSWLRISQRLEAVASLSQILESDFSIYDFSSKKLPFYSIIKAHYLLYSEETSRGVFLFLDRDAGVYYCKSVFCKDVSDYRENQSRWTVLKKVCRRSGEETLLYKSPTYKELQGTTLK